MHDCICSGRILEEMWDFEEAAEDVSLKNVEASLSSC